MREDGDACRLCSIGQTADPGLMAPKKSSHRCKP
jgi:hypothetical protein